MMKIEISPMKGGPAKCPHCGMEMGENESAAHEASPKDPMEDKKEEMKPAPKKKKFKSLEEVKAFAKKKFG